MDNFLLGLLALTDVARNRQQADHFTGAIQLGHDAALQMDLGPVHTVLNHLHVDGLAGVDDLAQSPLVFGRIHRHQARSLSRAEVQSRRSRDARDSLPRRIDIGAPQGTVVADDHVRRVVRQGAESVCRFDRQIGRRIGLKAVRGFCHGRGWQGWFRGRPYRPVTGLTEWPGSVRCNARPGLASGTGSSCHGSLGPGWWLTSGPEASIHLEIGNQNFIYVRAPRTWLLTSVKHAVQPRPMQQTPGRCDAEHRQISLSTGLLWLSADPHLRSPS